MLRPSNIARSTLSCSSVKAVLLLMWLISASSLQRNEFDPRNVYANVLLDKVPLRQVFNRGFLSFSFHIIPPLPFTPFLSSAHNSVKSGYWQLLCPGCERKSPLKSYLICSSFLLRHYVTFFCRWVMSSSVGSVVCRCMATISVALSSGRCPAIKRGQIRNIYE